MDIKKLIIGGIAGGVAFFLLGWLIYGNLLHSFMLHHSGERGVLARKEIKFVFLIAGNIAAGLLLTWIFLKANISSLSAGLTAGAVIGFLMAVAFDCMAYATSVMFSQKGMLADVIAFTVISALTGAVIGMLTGGGNQRS